jgi:hypothetical protein
MTTIGRVTRLRVGSGAGIARLHRRVVDAAVRGHRPLLVRGIERHRVPRPQPALVHDAPTAATPIRTPLANHSSRTKRGNPSEWSAQAYQLSRDEACHPALKR